MKKIENIIILEKKYNPRNLFSTLFVLKISSKPGIDNIDKRIIGKM